jgi:hypothetical protein
MCVAMLCVVRERSLRQTDPSSTGVLPMWRVWMCVVPQPQQWGGLGPSRAVAPQERETPSNMKNDKRFGHSFWANYVLYIGWAKILYASLGSRIYVTVEATVTVNATSDPHRHVDKLLLVLTEVFYVRDFPTSSTDSQEFFRSSCSNGNFTTTSFALQTTLARHLAACVPPPPRPTLLQLAKWPSHCSTGHVSSLCPTLHCPRMQLCCWKVAHSIAALIGLITRSPHN